MPNPDARPSPTMPSPSSSSSFSSPNLGSPIKPGFVRHPLLVVSTKQMMPQSSSSSSRRSKANSDASPIAAPSTPSSPVSATLANGSSSSRRGSQAVSPLHAALVRESMRLSIEDNTTNFDDNEELNLDDDCDDSYDMDHDTDRIEVDLRFPTFARRTQSSLVTTAATTASALHANRRQSSSLRAACERSSDDEAGSPSRNSEVGRGRARLRAGGLAVRISSAVEGDDFTPVEIDSKPPSHVLEDDTLFSLEDDDEAESKHNLYSYKPRTYSIATTDTTATETTAAAEDDADGDPSGSSFSLAYSSSSRSGARRASDRSSADLDMIWDEEENDDQVTTANTSMASRHSPDESDSSDGIANADLNKEASMPNAGDMKSAPRPFSGGYRSRAGSGQTNVMSPNTPSPSASQYVVPRLPFARRPSESVAMASSAYFTGRRRFSSSAQIATPFLARSRSMKQPKSGRTIGSDDSAPQHTASVPFITSRQGTPGEVTATASEVKRSDDAQPLTAEVHKPMSASSHSVSPTATLTTKPTTLTTAVVSTPSVHARKRSSTDPLAGVLQTQMYGNQNRVISGGTTTPRSAHLPPIGTQDAALRLRLSNSPFASLPVTPSGHVASRQPTVAQGYSSETASMENAAKRSDYYLRMYGLGVDAETAKPSQYGDRGISTDKPSPMLPYA